MTGIQTYAAVTQIINAVISISLGAYVLIKNPKPSTNRSFAAFAFSVALWGATYAMWVTRKDMSSALLWNRLLLVGCTPIPSVFLHFVINFLGQMSTKRMILSSSYILSGLFLLAIPTSLLIESVSPKMGFPFWGNPGPLFSLYLVQFLACFFYSHYLMYRQFKNTTGNQKNQIKYVLMGTFPAFIGGATNFPLWYNIPIPPIGNALVAIYVAMMAYAILQHNLMDVSIVVRKSLVYSILITILTASYFGLIYLVERFFQNTFGYRSIWLSVFSFALMTLLFQPLKSTIQKLVDHLVFGVSQEELAKRMERLEAQAMQAEKFKAVSTLAAGMAHEIKNPLTILQTYAQFVTEKHADPVFAKELQETLSAETKRIQGIVQELLDFAKPKAPRMQPVNLAQLIQSTVNLFSGEFLKHKITCSVDCDFNSTLLQADPDQMRQILINLVQNAIDAMPLGGKISIEGSITPNKEVVLKISDTGEGIPKHLLPKIFDPFVTGKETGNGLGLTMVYSIVQAHHGTIQVDSAPDQGTTFTLRFQR